LNGKVIKGDHAALTLFPQTSEVEELQPVSGGFIGVIT